MAEDLRQVASQLILALGSIQNAIIHVQACIITVRTLRKRGILTRDDAARAENEYHGVELELAQLKSMCPFT